MSKKTLLILIGIFAIVAMVGGFLYYSAKNNTNENTDTSLVNKIFSPFGAGKDNTAANDGLTKIDSETGAKSIIDGIFLDSRFKQITDFAVSGATFFIEQRPLPKKDEGETKEIKLETVVIKGKKVTRPIETPPEPTTEPVPAIRYMKKSDGHIYEMYMDTKIVGQISNSTIPEVYEGMFAINPNNIVYRLLADDNETIKTVVGVLGGAAGGFMPDGILDISISPNGKNFFSITPYSDGILGVIGSFNDSRKTQIFNSSFTEWLTQWPTEKFIFLTTKASHNTDGYLYALSTSTNSTKKVMGRIKGLTTLVSPNGNRVLYSYTTESGPKLGIYQISDNSYKSVSLYGLPEKCVWTNDSMRIYCAVPENLDSTQLPDTWYQGRVSFNDSFMRIDAETGTYNKLANSTEETSVDGIKLFIDDKEKTIFFINKKDNTLWSLDI